MAKEIKAAWLSHLPQRDDPVKRQNFKDAVINQVNNDPIVARLRELVKAEYDKAASATVPNGFENPNWAYHRAFIDGKFQSLQVILDLLEKIDE